MDKCVRVKLVEASLAEKDREERCDQGFGRPVAGIKLAAPPIAALEIVPTCRLRGWRGWPSLHMVPGPVRPNICLFFFNSYAFPNFPLCTACLVPGNPQQLLRSILCHYQDSTNASTCPCDASTAMSFQRPLRGHCACRRNQYYIRAPQGVTEVAQVIFSTGESHSTLAI